MKNKTPQESFAHLMTLAQQCHQKGELSAAATFYKEALSVNPGHPDALQLLGIVHCAQHNFKKGIRYLEQALAVQPENPVFLTNLSNAYYKTEAYANALPLLQKAITLKPGFDEAWYKLANTLKALNRTEEAIEAYRTAIRVNPNHHHAWYNLGNTQLQSGNLKSAIAAYEKVLSRMPDFAPAHNNLGIALQEWERMQEAEKHYLKAVQLNPSFREAIKNLCQLYEKAGKDDAATYWYHELLKQDPDTTALQFYKAIRSPALFNSREEIEQYQSALHAFLQHRLNNKPTSISSFIEYNCYPSSELLYQGKVCKEIRSLYADFYSETPTCEVTHSNDQCHAAFLVTAGHEGVFLKCMKGILNKIDTNVLDVSIVCSLPNGQKIIAPEITNPAIRFIPISSDFDLAQRTILDARIDILYYWEIGTDSLNYFLALGKPAHVQVTSWGWPATSGLKTVDYFLSQKNLETHLSPNHYTEDLILFDRMPVYYFRPPVPATPLPLSAYGLPENQPLYLCQQNLRKVHPDFDRLIAELLIRDENGIVLFIKDKQEAITQKLSNRLRMATGDNYSRIRFLDRMNEQEYLGLLTQCSVALDTLYYGGGANTIYDAVAESLPVVTLEGDHHSARFASAAFRQMNVTDTIVHSLQEYVTTAVKIANDKENRAHVVQKLNEKSSLLFEDMQAVKELEAFFMYEFRKIKNRK